MTDTSTVPIPVGKVGTNPFFHVDQSRSSMEPTQKLNSKNLATYEVGTYNTNVKDLLSRFVGTHELLVRKPVGLSQILLLQICQTGVEFGIFVGSVPGTYWYLP